MGLFDAGKDLVTGVWDFVTGEPITEIRPVETFNYIKKAILDSYERDVINGDVDEHGYLRKLHERQ